MILDTNVVVSALIQRGAPYQVVDTVLADSRLDLCLSPALVEEYTLVLGRRKFSVYKDFHTRALTLVADLLRRASIYSPTIRLDLVNDPADNRLLGLAQTCAADYLITGNIRDFRISSHGVTRIVTPRDFLEVLGRR